MTRSELERLLLQILIKHRKEISLEKGNALEMAVNDVALARAGADLIMHTSNERTAEVLKEIEQAVAAQVSGVKA